MLHRSPLYVLTTIFNPRRYASRYRLYHEFVQRLAPTAAVLYTVELAFGDRPFVVTRPDSPQHLQLRTREELWLKENSLNLLAQRLPPDWQCLAWIDADVAFVRPDWVEETLCQLEHTPVLQLFATAYDLGPQYQIVQRHAGFGASFRQGYRLANGVVGSRSGSHFWHPGFAWAMTRQAWNAVGGLLDCAILGAADHHMACAWLGQAQQSMPKDVHPGYREAVLSWQERAVRGVQQHLGYVDTPLLHYWHGKKHQRGYVERWDILRRNRFDPAVDLTRDWQGLWQLTGRCPVLRRDCQNYFCSRQEDSIDL